MSNTPVSSGAYAPPPLQRELGFNSPRNAVSSASSSQGGYTADGQGAVSVGSGDRTRAIAAEHRSTLGQIGSAALGVGKGVGRGVLAVAAVGVALGAAVGVGLPVAVLWGLKQGAQWLVDKATGPASAKDAAARGKANMRVEREVAAEVRFKQANQTLVDALQSLPGPSHLGSGTDYSRVVEKLVAHGADNGVTQAEIREWVTAGESVARALHAQPPGGKPVVRNSQGVEVEIKPCVYTVRALAWYVAAQTARQDVARENTGVGGGVNDLAKSGACVMKDPGNKVYDFLRSAPTCAPRMSTHFANRQDGGEKHFIGGLIPTFIKKEQHGIEDYCSKMPGPGGTLLFEKLRPSGGSGAPELFMKFESAGCPPYFCASEPHHTMGDRLLQVWHAGKRNLRHAFNFHESTKTGASTGIQRQEHVYKGFLEDVAKDYKALVTAAALLDLLPIKRAGVRYTRDEMVSGMKKQGLPFLKEMVQKMELEAAETSRRRPAYDELSLQAGNLRMVIESAEMALDAVSHVHGIERRGAEAHLSLNYDWHHHQAAPHPAR